MRFLFDQRKLRIFSMATLTTLMVTGGVQKAEAQSAIGQYAPGSSFLQMLQPRKGEVAWRGTMGPSEAGGFDLWPQWEYTPGQKPRKVKSEMQFLRVTRDTYIHWEEDTKRLSLGSLDNPVGKVRDAQRASQLLGLPTDSNGTENQIEVVFTPGKPRVAREILIRPTLRQRQAIAPRFIQGVRFVPDRLEPLKGQERLGLKPGTAYLILFVSFDWPGQFTSERKGEEAFAWRNQPKTYTEQQAYHNIRLALEYARNLRRTYGGYGFDVLVVSSALLLEPDECRERTQKFFADAQYADFTVALDPYNRYATSFIGVSHPGLPMLGVDDVYNPHARFVWLNKNGQVEDWKVRLGCKANREKTISSDYWMQMVLGRNDAPTLGQFAWATHDANEAQWDPDTPMRKPREASLPEEAAAPDADALNKPKIPAKLAVATDIGARISEIRARWQTYKPRFTGVPFTEVPQISPPYTSGRLDPAFAADGLNAINFARFVASLPDDVVWDESNTRQAQCGALLLNRLGKLTHTPSRPEDFPEDLFRPARDNLGSSNIAVGPNTLDESVKLWLDDEGNPRLGHRRWILNPILAKTAMGMVNGFSTMYAFDTSGTGDAAIPFIAWPANRAHPVEWFTAKTAWSLTLNPGLYDVQSCREAQIRMTRKSDGKVWALSPQKGQLIFDTQGFGVDNCLIWTPDALSQIKPNDVFEIEVKGLRGIDGQAKPLNYSVCFFGLDS